jgi:hypothetical protein
VLAAFAPNRCDNGRFLAQEWLAEAVTMWGIAALVVVVTAVAGDAAVTAAAALDADDAGLVLRTDAGEHSRVVNRCRERLVVKGTDVGAGQRRAIAQPEVMADLAGHHRVVASDDLNRDAEIGQSAQRHGCVVFRRVKEDQEPLQVQTLFVPAVSG